MAKMDNFDVLRNDCALLAERGEQRQGKKTEDFLSSIASEESLWMYRNRSIRDN
jgi:hypothetical protein